MSATYKQNKCFILCPLVFLFPYFTGKKKKKQTDKLAFLEALLTFLFTSARATTATLPESRSPRGAQQ